MIFFCAPPEGNPRRKSPAEFFPSAGKNFLSMSAPLP